MLELLGGGVGQMAGTLGLAAAVQKAVDSGQYVFVTIILLMLGIQLAKALSGRRADHVRKNAGRYSAGGGAVIGGVVAQYTGADPVAGAAGGMLMGNAASGLFSTVIKPLGRLFSGAWWLYLIPVVLPMVGILLQKLRKTPAEKRRELLSGFDNAMKETMGEKPSTKELEAWISKVL